LRYPSTEIASAVSGALRALSVGVPVALVAAPASAGDTVGSATLSADIPAQPLATALAAFAKQTDLQFVYVSGIAVNQKSRAVPAGLPVSEALSRLLEGTGLRYEYLASDTVHILAAPSSAVASRPNVPAPPISSEIVITANRREELLQDVPITVQALTGGQLKQLNVKTFNDLLQYTPNVTFSSNGPGTGNIFIRGLGYVGAGNQSQATIAPFPSVALYLDNQSMQFPSRNNDVYMVDLERVEVLEGPQGTLFGGGAEAGVIRYVTNKPKFGGVSGEFSAGYGITAHGDPNSALYGVFNLPVLPEKLALRAVIFADRRGGYIDNVSSTIGYPADSPQVLAGVNPIANNAALVARATNSLSYQGLRLSALWKISDGWNFLLQQNYQSMDADGYFYAYPHDSNGAALGRYQIAAFEPAYTKDRYESTAWTLNGLLGDLRIVYAGSYMERHILGQQDYSNYLRSTSGSNYGCIGPGAGYFNDHTFPSLAGQPLRCYAPVGYWRDAIDHSHHIEELRISTNEARRVRGLVGAYWEKFVINDNMNFNYMNIPQCDPANLTTALAGGAPCLSAVGPVPGTQASDPGIRESMQNAFGEDVQRGYKQYAFFASVDVDIVPNFTLTLGTRRYHYDEFEHGSSWYSETSSPLILNHPNGACTAAATLGMCGYPMTLDKSEGGFRSRGTLTWHVTPDVMTYYTYSEGFRAGGYNRTLSLAGQPPVGSPIAPYCGPASKDPRCQPGGSLYNACFQSLRPIGYGSDNLVNHEVGLKSELLDHRLLVNVSAYRMKWIDVQSPLFDPDHLGNVVWMSNGPSYLIKGVELQLVARVSEGLTVQGSSSWNSSSTAATPCIVSVGQVNAPTQSNPTPAGKCVTIVGGLPYASPWGALGSRPPYSPPLMFNVRVRYDWPASDYRPFAWIGASHVASMLNAPANYPDGNDPSQTPPTSALLKYSIPGLTTYDAALGVAKGQWTVQLQGSNLTNAYGPTNISSAQFIELQVPVRPRVLTAQIAYSF